MGHEQCLPIDERCDRVAGCLAGQGDAHRRGAREKRHRGDRDASNDRAQIGKLRKTGTARAERSNCVDVSLPANLTNRGKLPVDG